MTKGLSRTLKLGLAASLCLVLLLGTYHYASTRPGSTAKDGCPFCTTSIIETQSIYTGPYCRVLYNYRPFEPGHGLIIPKRHVSRIEDLSPEEWTEVHTVVQLMTSAFETEYEAHDFVLALQNGRNAGQTVFHTHFHMIPRSSYNVRTKIRFWYKILTETLLYGTWKPLDKDQLAAVVSKLSLRIDEARSASQ